MERISQPFSTNGVVYYLPHHHGVLKLESTTIKLRVVFDASSKCTNDQSLNRVLVGPKLQADVMDVLIKFRIGAVTLTADVKQMFRQIWIHPSQRDYQRIVWHFSEDEPWQTYRRIMYVK